MKSLKDALSRLKLLCDIDIAMADLLCDHGERIQKLEDDYKLLRKQFDALNTRHVELQMVVGEMRRGQK